MQVAEALLNSRCERLKRRFLKSSRRRKTQDETRKASTPLEPPLFRLAETIRRQIRRYRNQHPDWRRDFDYQLGTVSIEQIPRSRVVLARWNEAVCNGSPTSKNAGSSNGVRR